MSQCEVLRELRVGDEMEQGLLQEPGRAEGVGCPQWGCILSAQGWRGERQHPGTCLSPSPCACAGKGALGEVLWGELAARRAQGRMHDGFVTPREQGID